MMSEKTAERDYNFMRDLAVGSEEILNKVNQELNDTKELLAERNLQLLEVQNKLIKGSLESQKPLSDDEIWTIDKSIAPQTDLNEGKLLFARAIEAKHGIK